MPPFRNAVRLINGKERDRLDVFVHISELRKESARGEFLGSNIQEAIFSSECFGFHRLIRLSAAKIITEGAIAEIVDFMNLILHE